MESPRRRWSDARHNDLLRRRTRQAMLTGMPTACSEERGGLGSTWPRDARGPGGGQQDDGRHHCRARATIRMWLAGLLVVVSGFLPAVQGIVPVSEAGSQLLESQYGKL